EAVAGHVELLRPRDRRTVGEDLPAAGVDHGPPTRERVERRDTGDGDAEPEREAARRREPDADAREAPGAGADDDPVDARWLEARRAQQFVGRDEDEARLRSHLVDRLVVAYERTGRDRGGGVKGEDRCHWRS